MTTPDTLSATVERVAKCQQTDADIALIRQALAPSDEQNVVQLGKYNINIGQGQDIQIGDRIYQSADAETIRDVVRSLLQEMLMPNQPTVEELTLKAVDALGSHNYEELRNICSSIIKLQPNHPKANLLLAIALLQGKGADNLQKSTLDLLESHIKKSLHDPFNSATAWAVWGVIRHDYYVPHGLAMGEPRLKDIRHQLQKSDHVKVDFSVLGKVKTSLDALEYFGLNS
jgi:hypothetical protein